MTPDATNAVIGIAAVYGAERLWSALNKRPHDLSPAIVRDGFDEGRAAMSGLACGVQRVPPSQHEILVDDRNVGLDFIRESYVQKHSYAAHFGVYSDGTPRMTNVCLYNAVGAWLDAWERAYKANPTNWQLVENRNAAAFALSGGWVPVTDVDRAAAGLAGDRAYQAIETEWLTDLGRAYRRLRASHWPSLGGSEAATREAWAAIHQMATRLDTQGIRPDFNVESIGEVIDEITAPGSYLALLGDGAAAVAKRLPGALANLLLHPAGAALAFGGAAYLVLRR